MITPNANRLRKIAAENESNWFKTEEAFLDYFRKSVDTTNTPD